uniref:Small ribosomal subunit protein uS10m n=1 Tax=Triatoma dimidiata TaxID=72491 RepID=A0A0V0G804_TRIDM
MLLPSSLTPIAFTRIALISVQRVQSTLSSLKSEDENDKLYKLIELEMRSNDQAVLKSYSQFVNETARELNINVGERWAPKKAVHDRLTLLRSIHVKKKYRVQYETRTYFSFMQLHKLTGSTTNTFLEYIQRNLPEGVALKVAKVALEKFPDHIKQIPPALENAP